MKDYLNQEGMFAQDVSSRPSKSSEESSHSLVFSLGNASPSFSFPSPFDALLSKLHLQVDDVLRASSNLHMPLSTLLWAHSFTLPSQDCHICSWNTILNYPSLIPQHSTDSSQESSDSYESKRRKKEPTLDKSPMKQLSALLAQCYFEAKNPYAAMSLMESDQIDQQLLIQCTTKRNGFTSAYQMVSAYASFYENPQVIGEARSALDPNGTSDSDQLWKSWPWRQLSQWKALTVKEKVACLDDSMDAALLRMEFQRLKGRQNVAIPFTSYLSELGKDMVERESEEVKEE